MASANKRYYSESLAGGRNKARKAFAGINFNFTLKKPIEHAGSTVASITDVALPAVGRVFFNRPLQPGDMVLRIERAFTEIEKRNYAEADKRPEYMRDAHVDEEDAKYARTVFSDPANPNQAAGVRWELIRLPSYYLTAEELMGAINHYLIKMVTVPLVQLRRNRTDGHIEAELHPKKTNLTIQPEWRMTLNPTDNEEINDLLNAVGFVRFPEGEPGSPIFRKRENDTYIASNNRQYSVFSKPSLYRSGAQYVTFKTKFRTEDGKEATGPEIRLPLNPEDESLPIYKHLEPGVTERELTGHEDDIAGQQRRYTKGTVYIDVAHSSPLWLDRGDIVVNLRIGEQVEGADATSPEGDENYYRSKPDWGF